MRRWRVILTATLLIISLPSFSHGFSQRHDSRAGGRSQANRDDHGYRNGRPPADFKNGLRIEICIAEKSGRGDYQRQYPRTHHREARKVWIWWRMIGARITFTINARLCLGVCDLMVHAGKRTCAVRAVIVTSLFRLRMVRPLWRKLHYLVFPAFILVFIHSLFTDPALSKWQRQLPGRREGVRRDLLRDFASYLGCPRSPAGPWPQATARARVRLRDQPISNSGLQEVSMQRFRSGVHPTTKTAAKN
jgi:hypothetical protein